MAKACCDSCTTKVLSALCSRWRSLRSAAQRPQIQATRGIRSNAIAGFTTATPPIAGCASGYREMGLLSNLSPQKHQSRSSRCGFFVPGASAPVAQAPDQLAKACYDSCITKALLALCSRWRSLHSAAQRPQTQATRCIRSNAITGFTTAAPPIAGCASGYREVRLLSNFSPQKPQSCSSRCGCFVPGASAPVAQAPDQLAKACCDSCTTKALLALCSRWRSLRPAAQRPQTQATRCIRSNAITGFTTATPPIAGCASGYREMRLLSNFHPAETPKLQLTLRLFCPRGISACGAGGRSTG